MPFMISGGGRYNINKYLSVDASLRYDVTFTNVENNTHPWFAAGRADTYNMTAGVEIGVNYILR